MLRDSFILESSQRVGFMAGFEWQRQNAIDFNIFIQQWYGPVEHRNIVFRTLHRQIEITRDFPEHTCIQVFRFIVNLIVLAFVALMIISIIGVSEGDKQYTKMVLYIVGALLTVGLRGSSRFIYFIAGWTLKKKIKKAIDDCNLYLAKFGYKACFPQVRKKWLFCIPLWKSTRLQRIQIFDVHGKRVVHGNFFGQIEMITQDQSTIRTPKAL